MNPATWSLRRARLPAWSLPANWPRERGTPALADLGIADGRFAWLRPAAQGEATAGDVELAGALVLPGLVDAHTHLDKAFTISRLGPRQPGLDAAITAMLDDRRHWTAADVRSRAQRGIELALAAGVRRLRTHCDWWEPEATPLAWSVLGELAAEQRGRLRLERVSLIPLLLFEDRALARRLAHQVARSGPDAVLGAFVHSTQWSPLALRHLIEEAGHHDLDLDLHVDEELDPAAQGLITTSRLARQTGYEGRIVCGHSCALAAAPPEQAQAMLDEVAAAPITLVCLPTTNLLLQDAQPGRTPRARGLTLVKEARARDIPVLLASDNVQDAFCPIGRFDPLEPLNIGLLAAQLDEPFDQASALVCQESWLDRETRPAWAVGARADLVIFPDAEAASGPAAGAPRVVLRAGRPAASASLSFISTRGVTRATGGSTAVPFPSPLRSVLP